MCSHGLYIKCISIRAAPSEKLQKRRQMEKEAKNGPAHFSMRQGATTPSLSTTYGK